MNARLPFVSMDQVELVRGLEAEIRSTLERLKPDTRRSAEMLLEGLGFSEEDYNGPLCDYADDQYNRMSESEREDAGWRFWDDEAYGARLPRLSRMRRMLCAGLAVAALCLTGCGERTQINSGADLAVYVGSTQWMHERKPWHKGNPSYFGGYYDPEDGSITVNEQAHEWMLAGIFAHELIGHAWDHQKPRDGWELLARYHSPAFQLLTHSQEQIEAGREFMAQCPDPLDVKRALEAGRLAEQEAKP